MKLIIFLAFIFIFLTPRICVALIRVVPASAEAGETRPEEVRGGVDGEAEAVVSVRAGSQGAT